MNTVKYNNFMVYPIINGMSDHDTQIIILHDITVVSDITHFNLTWKINKFYRF
jgi:hypothetical protein